MQFKHYIISFFALAIGFTGGFLVANGLNKSEIQTLSAKNAELQNSATAGNQPEQKKLSNEEVSKLLDTASKSPDDADLQKRTAFEIYRDAAASDDTGRFADVEKLLERAFTTNPEDFDVLAALAQLKFSLGKIKKDEKRIADAKAFYKKASAKRPDDVRLLIGFAASLLDLDTPDGKGAIEVLQKAYKVDSKDEMVLFYMVKAHTAAGNLKEASDFLAELKEVNPKNGLVADIEKRLTEETPK